jgi:Flp pilus assembly protein TadG
MVEFALLLPIMLLILMGILWFGRAMNYAQDATHLANEAARFAAVNVNPAQLPGASATCSGLSLQACIQSQADSNELQSGNATLCVSFPNGTSNTGDPVKVTVRTTNFSWIPLFNPPIPVDQQIGGSAVMRLEAPATNYSAGCT